MKTFAKKVFMYKKYLIICKVLILFSTILVPGNSYSEQVNLQSYASGFDSIPIAVLPFKSSNSTMLSENKPWDVIADDLDFSGRFFVVKMQKADSAGFARNQVGIFIDGEYTLTGDKIVIDCYLHDASSKDLLVGKQ